MEEGRISCNVTKDLLPPYLDKVCSDETRELVEEHLRECASCREFMQALQTEESEEENLKLDYLKKSRRFLTTRALQGCMITFLILAPLGIWALGSYGRVPLWFFYVTMPVLMITYATAMAGGVERPVLSKKKWILPLCAGVLLLYALLLHGVILAVICGAGKIHLESTQISRLGSFLSGGVLMGLIGEVILLTVSICLSPKGQWFYQVSRNTGWLGLYLLMTFERMLYNMSTPREVAWNMLWNMVILAAEFAAVTIGWYLYQRRREFWKK
ncbi:MAG: zf-HC2 domain-containing protein [Roseburia sp.]|nr:zf-HC2 domain-containing protein [Roseburia sp.]